MQVYNKRQVGARTLPNGQVIQAGAAVEVDDDAWQGMKGHPVVKAWLDGRELGTGRPQPEPDAKPALKSDDLSQKSDDELRAMLEASGRPVDGRWGREKLLKEASTLQG